MEIFDSRVKLFDFVAKERNNGKSIGFVPTMGALHDGHLSLVTEAQKKVDITICSIYVNPTQFNVKTDLDNYPRNTSSDIELLESAGCDICFLPTTQDIYPNGTTELLRIDLNGLDKEMEGEHRPGHFDGVVTVVNNLFNIITPDFAYFGEKDYQQLLIIRKMAQVMKINTKIIGCPIFREMSGLAMSSRNERLSLAELENAAFIYATLKQVKRQNNTAKEKKAWATQQFEKHPLLTLDYFEIVSESAFRRIDIDSSLKQRALVAAFIGGVRLIDNIELNN